MRKLAVLLLAVPVLAQSHHRRANRALLGIVAVPYGQSAGLLLAHVLKDSPAARAGLQAGDALLAIGTKTVKVPADVDTALRPFAGDEDVAVTYKRDGKKKTAQAKLVARANYTGDFLRRRPRNATGFRAPDWFVYSWARAGTTPPTGANTKDKVVVIHCFQSW